MPDHRLQFFLNLAPPNKPYLHNDLDYRVGPPDWPGGDEAWREFRRTQPVNTHSHLIAMMLGTSECVPIRYFMLDYSILDLPTHLEASCCISPTLTKSTHFCPALDFLFGSYIFYIYQRGRYEEGHLSKYYDCGYRRSKGKARHCRANYRGEVNMQPISSIALFSWCRW